MYICNSLIKHGYCNFSLTILEYCEPSQCLIREKHYLNLLQHEYNISQDPTASMSGRKHTEESKQIMSDTAKKIQNPGRFKTGQKHSDETKRKMSDANIGEKNPMFGKNHIEESKRIMSEAKKGENNPMYNKPRPEGAGKASQQIEVTDIKNNTTTCYNSISEAAKALNISSYIIISNYFLRNQTKPYKGKYTFKKI
jgi:group I intron endonuclease